MSMTRSYHSYLIESLKDPQEAAAYLDAALDDGTVEEVRLALANVVEAQISGLDGSTQPSHQQAIYEMLIQQNKLESFDLLKIINELGFRLSVSPRDAA